MPHEICSQPPSGSTPLGGHTKNSVEHDTHNPNPHNNAHTRTRASTLCPNSTHNPRTVSDDCPSCGTCHQPESPDIPRHIVPSRCGGLLGARGQAADGRDKGRGKGLSNDIGDQDPGTRVRATVSRTLNEWSSEHTIERVRSIYASSYPSYNVFEQATGGCLDTAAAALAGFSYHLGGTEDITRPMGRVKAKVFEDVSSAKCLGDARDWRKWSKNLIGLIDYYKAGMPCTDYASLGYQEGCLGKKGGDLFLLQIETILHLLPKICRLEMVPTALDVNNGYEVRKLVSELSKKYTVHADIIECWRYGDPTARTRLIIIGLRRDIFEGVEWEWPDHMCDDSWYPTARDVAVDDSEVPDQYWISDDCPREFSTIHDPVPGRVQQIGYAGTDSDWIQRKAGFSSRPFNIQGWDGCWATQMATNGGSRRPSLHWSPGQPLTPTRMTVPVESCKVASLDPVSYIRLANKHYSKKQLSMTRDQWLRELVNLGVPLMTGIAIDKQVHEMLRRAGVKPSMPYGNIKDSVAFSTTATSHVRKCSDCKCCHVHEKCDIDDELIYPCDVQYVRMSNAMSAGACDGLTMGIGDSGATDHLHDSSFNECLSNPRPSRTRYATAGEGSIKGDLVGELDVSVLNLNSQPNCPDYIDHTFTTTTVKGLGPPLFSLEASFRDQGYDVHLCHGYKKNDFTGLYRPPEGRQYGPESFIPMVYNWQGSGGWRVPYVVRRPGVSEDQHLSMLKSILEQNRVDTSRIAMRALQLHEYTESQANRLEQYYWACPAVSQTVSVRVPGERDIRPAFHYGGLRRYKHKNWHEFHSAMGHFGEPGQPCAICDMYKGNTIPVPRHRKGKPRERRAGHTWHLDLVEFRYRSEEGCKYLLVLTDETTQFYQLIPLYWKSDAPYEIERWIRHMRRHPAFLDLEYQMIAQIVTDNESVWNDDASKFQNMLDRVGGVTMDYAAPEDHARGNARAEGSNKIIEAGIQSIMYEQNLPPSWWQRISSDVMFLANRFVTISNDTNIPPDQDRASPIEQLFQGYISRNQVYRELDNYVQVGTPALCRQPKVKGSHLEPKVRWGIAIGQRGKTTRWLCPFTRSQFRNRTFTSFTLRSGMNWSQFLGLGDIAPSKQSRMLPQDDKESWTIELPEVRQNVVQAPPPVREITERVAEGEDVPTIKAELIPDRELCQYFPKLKRGTPNQNLETTGEEGNNSDEGDTDTNLSRLTVKDSRGNTLDLTNPDRHDDDFPVDSDDDAHIDTPPVDSNQLDSADHSLEHDLEKPSSRRKRGMRKKRSRKGSSLHKPSPPSHKPQTVVESDATNMMMDPDMYVDAYGLRDEDEKELEELEARLVRKYKIVTDGQTSWTRVCKMMHAHLRQLPFVHHDTYRLWLLTKPLRSGEKQLFVEDLPKDLCKSRSYLPQGLELPYPSGPHWIRLCSNKGYYKEYGDKLEEEDRDEEQSYLAMSMYVRALHRKDVVPIFAMACSAIISEQVPISEFNRALNSVVTSDIEEMGISDYACAYKARKLKKRVTVSEAGDPAPATMIDALLSDRAEEWVESIYKEFNGLCKQGVFSHNYTKADLAKQGIISKPVPCSTALTHKYADGILTKLKTRICIAGHKGNVTKGVHYHEVFSPSPVQHTEKVLQSMMVQLHLHNIAYDICQAYTWAPLPPGQRIAVVYPDGFKRRCPKTGEELYAILEYNLYGMPSAGRGWSEHRNKFILSKFNQGPWSCRQCVHDPCLFVIDKQQSNRGGQGSGSGESIPGIQQPPSSLAESDDLPDGTDRSWVLIHTDDCDCYGTSLSVLHEINDIMNEEWETQLVDRSYVLGVKRNLVQDTEGWHVTLTMTSFIDDLVKLFRAHLDQEFGRRTVSIPFPENLILTKADTTSDEEVQHNINRGYQRLVGSLLWVVRHIFPICSYGCSQLCKMMSCPSDKAWHAALHMLKYIEQHRGRGVKFSETDDEPCAFVDASNKDDPYDGKTQYGYTIHWGGPLITKSSKLNHVGINSTYNEYMALHHCIKQVVWLRQLMTEMGLANYISMPTTVYADNKQANNLCKEDLVTAGNMYFRTGYHYNKEAVKDKYVSVEYIHTSLNCSDATTKGLGSNKIKLFEPILHGHAPLSDLLRSL